MKKNICSWHDVQGPKNLPMEFHSNLVTVVTDGLMNCTCWNSFWAGIDAAVPYVLDLIHIQVEFFATGNCSLWIHWSFSYLPRPSMTSPESRDPNLSDSFSWSTSTHIDDLETKHPGRNHWMKSHSVGPHPTSSYTNFWLSLTHTTDVWKTYSCTLLHPKLSI